MWSEEGSKLSQKKPKKNRKALFCDPSHLTTENVGIHIIIVYVCKVQQNSQMHRPLHALLFGFILKVNWWFLVRS